MYKLSSAAYNTSLIGAAGVAGTTYRLCFSWKSDGSDIVNPPAAIDEVSLTASAPSTFTATAQGGLWSSPGTWVGGLSPVSGVGNSIVIPAGSVVTVDQVINYQDYTINGGMQWNATATNTMTATGNVTIGGGSFYPFTTGLAGVQINLLGNFTNNSYANLALSTLVFGGTGTQTLGGTGTYEGMAGTGAVVFLLCKVPARSMWLYPLAFVLFLLSPEQLPADLTSM